MEEDVYAAALAPKRKSSRSTPQMKCEEELPCNATRLSRRLASTVNIALRPIICSRGHTMKLADGPKRLNGNATCTPDFHRSLGEEGRAAAGGRTLQRGASQI